MRVLLLLVCLIMLSSYAYATPDTLTGDPTIRKGMAYGDYNGKPVRMAVDVNGVLQLG